MCHLIIAIALFVPGIGDIEIPAGTQTYLTDSGPLMFVGEHEFPIEWEDTTCGADQ
jgi:hypothetical protein